MHTSVQALLFITDSADEIERTRTGPFGDRSIAGSANAIVDAIGRYTELGFDEFIVPDFNLGKTPEQRREGLQRIDAEIVAQCR